MFSILNRALSWAITSFGNRFCLKKRSRLIKASDNRYYVKFMQLEIGLFLNRRGIGKNTMLSVLLSGRSAERGGGGGGGAAAATTTTIVVVTLNVYS